MGHSSILKFHSNVDSLIKRYKIIAFNKSITLQKTMFLERYSSSRIGRISQPTNCQNGIALPYF